MIPNFQTPTFKVGTIPIYGDLVLSPMDGYSDQPFRSLCRCLGSAMSYSEFINAIDVLQALPIVRSKLAYLPEERPVVFQLFDDNPERLLKAALKVMAFQPDIIDINMGCSARTVAGRGAGAGLLRSPEKIAAIFTSLSKALPIPVTGKIRLGWDDTARNYMQIAKIIEENGGALLAVHGRTKSQGLAGQADWDAIADIRQAVHIPVIGNGDVRSVADIERMKTHTGCQAIMIGRGAIGNPWIFARQDRLKVAPEQVKEILQRHLEANLAFYGADKGLILFRKHVSRYISPYPLPEDTRLRLLRAQKMDEIKAILADIFDSVHP